MCHYEEVIIFPTKIHSLMVFSLSKTFDPINVSRNAVLPHFPGCGNSIILYLLIKMQSLIK